MTEFIAQAKRKDNGEWIEGAVIKFKGDCEVCDYSSIDCSRYDVNPETVRYKCPKTPYFEHDVLKVVDDLGEEVIAEILFFQGAFLFPIEEDELITIPNLIECGYNISLLGNSIDTPELLEQCTSK
jgi:hypothetical protein